MAQRLSDGAGKLQESGSVRVERREDKIVLLCDDCDLPFALISAEGIEIQSKHHSSKHTNTLRWDETDKLISALDLPRYILR